MTRPGAIRIAAMTEADLGRALDWAAAEGWNPGLADAAAFHAADPGGFLMGRVGGTPVACVSVVRHDAAFAFLGLYLCRPEFRGRGHGMALWRAGLALAGERTIGLDGVAAQQENYRRSGFVAAGRTLRFGGRLAPGASEGLVSPARLGAAIAALDRAATGVTRPAFLAAWLCDGPTRRTLCRVEGGRLAACGSVRRCREGVKVGPLLAASGEAAARVLAGLAAVFPGEPLLIDVPESNPAALALAEGLGLAPVFATARMYRGRQPAGDDRLTWGVATLELG